MTMPPGLDSLQGVLKYRERLLEIVAEQAEQKPADRVPVALMPSTLVRMLDALLDLIPQSTQRLPSQGVLTASGRQARRPMPQNRTDSPEKPPSMKNGSTEPPTTQTPLSTRRKRKRRH